MKGLLYRWEHFFGYSLDKEFDGPGRVCHPHLLSTHSRRCCTVSSIHPSSRDLYVFNRAFDTLSVEITHYFLQVFYSRNAESRFMYSSLGTCVKSLLHNAVIAVVHTDKFEGQRSFPQTPTSRSRQLTH
jgi:hypothetical protein